VLLVYAAGTVQPWSPKRLVIIAYIVCITLFFAATHFKRAISRWLSFTTRQAPGARSKTKVKSGREHRHLSKKTNLSCVSL
jgi:hypothetical protein